MLHRRRCPRVGRQDARLPEEQRLALPHRRPRGHRRTRHGHARPRGGYPPRHAPVLRRSRRRGQAPGGSLHQDCLPDHHRVRLPRPTQRGRPQVTRARQPRRPRGPIPLHARVPRRELRQGYRLRTHPLGARDASPPRPQALHRHVLRQPPAQRRRRQEARHQRRARRSRD